MLIGLIALGVDLMLPFTSKDAPEYIYSKCHVNFLRHLVNMWGGFAHIFELRVSRLPYFIIQLCNKVVFKINRIFTYSKVNRVGLHNLRVNAML